MNRYGLTVGINAYGGGNTLQGCVNDARDMSQVLAQRGYEVTCMLDDAATRANLLDALAAHVGRLRYRDRLVVHYSGHGTRVPDQSGDEPDAWDEAWVSQDLRVIVDDDLAVLFAARAYGSRIVVLSDSCYSGTVTRVGSFADTTVAAADMAHPRKRKSLPFGVLASTARDRRFATTPSTRVAHGADCLLISGAQSDEYSYDAWFQLGGQWRANGAFTKAALDALGHGPTTYAAWWTDIELPTTNYPQTPELDGSWLQKRWGVFD